MQFYRSGELYTSCNEFNKTVLAALKANPPDYVITSQRGGKSAASASSTPTSEQGVAGLVDVWNTLGDLGTTVIVIIDNPSPTDGDIPGCVEANRADITPCSFSKAVGVARSAATTQKAAAASARGVRTIDLADAICPGDTCPAVIGGVLVYRTGSHLTATYAATLTPRLFEALAAIAKD